MARSGPEGSVWRLVGQGVPLGAVTVDLSPDGLPVADFLLHKEGAEAWFRWSE
ncbi:hypothetical protein [Streptomyces sp. H34-S4]|uniref:hypothetical protein n=1 Tax=Streptomyces sp. H34-S4 TaxID=2996463 RepID=UPI00226ED1D1|nr:hypothetical protein [Streptomyces sp. H34-S4]MCY0936342.1 hypothetical protein [Streptomyces sp. H34-S4]